MAHILRDILRDTLKAFLCARCYFNLKTKLMKPLPYKYYKEYCGELAKAYLDAKMLPQRQQKRIDDVLASGLDYEVMQGGNGNSWQIHISKLYEFLKQAKSVDTDKIKEVYLNFKNNHTGIKGWVGDLKAAKIEAELKKLKSPEYFDSKYDFYSQLCNRYILNNKQSEQLMKHFLKLEIL